MQPGTRQLRACRVALGAVLMRIGGPGRWASALHRAAPSYSAGPSGHCVGARAAGCTAPVQLRPRRERRQRRSPASTMPTLRPRPRRARQAERRSQIGTARPVVTGKATSSVSRRPCCACRKLVDDNLARPPITGAAISLRDPATEQRRRRTKTGDGAARAGVAVAAQSTIRRPAVPSARSPGACRFAGRSVLDLVDRVGSGHAPGRVGFDDAAAVCSVSTVSPGSQDLPAASRRHVFPLIGCPVRSRGIDGERSRRTRSDCGQPGTSAGSAILPAPRAPMRIFHARARRCHAGPRGAGCRRNKSEADRRSLPSLPRSSTPISVFIGRRQLQQDSHEIDPARRS